MRAGKTGGLSASAQMKWEVSKDIRLQKQQITGQDVEPSTAAQVTVWVFINRPVLISGLIRAQVISSASTFQEFMDAFNSVPQCFMIDIGTNAPEMKMAGM